MDFDTRMHSFLSIHLDLKIKIVKYHTLHEKIINTA